MARPPKRRKLSSWTSLQVSAQGEFAFAEPIPRLAHSVHHLDRIPTREPVRPVPQRIEEIHWQVQERNIFAVRNQHNALHRRQASEVASAVTTVDSAGTTIVSTVTAGLDTGSSTVPIPPTTSSALSGSSYSGTSSNSTSIYASTSGPSLILSSSTNSTDLSSSSRIHEGHHNHSSSLYVATLTNGHVETVTRSTTPYLTTFADGQVSTICGRTGHCRLSKIGQSTKSFYSPSSHQSQGSISPGASAGAGGQGTQGAPSSTPTSSSHHGSGNSSTPPPGTIAGGVVGGAAGLAVILLAAMIFFRWYRRRQQQGPHALPPISTESHNSSRRPSSQPGMAERAGLRPIVGAVPALFRHQNRSEEPPPSERSFTRVSGRKLPSAFSEGMTSDPPPSMPVPAAGPEPNLAGRSFYRDSYGFYGGDGKADEVPAQAPSQSGMAYIEANVVLSPGPQRTPRVHSGGPWVTTPRSWSPDAHFDQSSPTIGDHIARSETPSSLPDNRSSRFTEEV